MINSRAIQPISNVAVSLAAAFALLWVSQSDRSLFLVLVLLLGFTIFLASLAYPFLGTQLTTLSLFVTVPIVGNTFGGMAFANIRAAQLFAIIGLVALLARRSIHQVPHPPMRIFAPFSLWIVCMFISISNSDYVDDSIRHMVKVLGAQAVIFYLIVSSIQTRQHIERIVKLLSIAAILVTWIGIVQVVAFEYFQIVLFTTPWSYKPTALFTESGWYGIYLSVLFSLFFPLALSREFLSARRLLYAALVHCVAAMGLSQNRGAVISAGLAFAMTLTVFSNASRSVMQARIRKAALIVLLLAVPGLLVHEIWPETTQVFYDKIAQSGLDDSSRARLDRFAAEMAAIEQHPIIGNGVGTWGRNVYSSMAESRENYIVTETIRGGSSFNIFVGALYDGGVLGLISLLWLLGSIVWLLLMAYWKSRLDWERSILSGFLLSFLAMILNSLFNPLYQTDLAFAVSGLAIASLNVVLANSGQRSFP